MSCSSLSIMAFNVIDGNLKQKVSEFGGVASRNLIKRTVSKASKLHLILFKLLLGSINNQLTAHWLLNNRILISCQRFFEIMIFLEEGLILDLLLVKCQFNFSNKTKRRRFLIIYPYLNGFTSLNSRKPNQRDNYQPRSAVVAKPIYGEFRLSEFQISISNWCLPMIGLQNSCSKFQISNEFLWSFVL